MPVGLGFKRSAAVRVARLRQTAITSWPTLVLALLWLLVTLANVSKAVHIDDPTYLIISRHILEDPLHPMSGSFVLSGAPKSIASTNQPPLLFYGFALIMGIFGESPVALHLLISLFSGLAIACFYGLGTRICPQNALGLTVILALGPAFLPAQNLMTDVPTLSLWLLFGWILVKDRDAHDRGRSYVVAAIVAAAACLIKYPSLVLLPLLWMLIALRRDWRHAGTPLIAVGVLLAWSIFNLFDFGAVHLLTRPTQAPALGATAYSLETWVICLGAVAPFSVLLLATRSWRPALVALGVTALVLLVHPERAEGSIPYAQTLGRVFLLNGILVVLLPVVALGWGRAGTTEHKLLLAGWMAAGTGFIVLFAPFIAVRHVLLVVPPILLSIGLALEGRDTRILMPLACALTIILGGALALSDWVYADLYRTQAKRLREQLGDRGDLWYLGNWGWRWYAEAEGMKPYLPGRSRLRLGDTVIIAELPTGLKQLAADDQKRAEHLVTLPVPASASVLFRTMAPPPLGGYYALGRAGLPWHLSREPLDRFGILRVVGD